MFEWLPKWLSDNSPLIFVIFFLSLVVGAIVLVNFRSKCTIPDNIDPLTTPLGSDGYPQVPVCPDELGAYIFEDATTKCDDPTVGMPPGKSPYYCDYSNNYSWVYQTSGKPQPGVNTCDLTESNLLPFPITYDQQTLTNIYKPVSNSLSYSYVSIEGGACFLSQCDSDTVVWPDKTSNAEFCAPKNAGDLGCPPSNYNEFKTSHNTYPDSNAIYKYTYMSNNPTLPLCEFFSCSAEGAGFVGDPCMPRDPGKSDCTRDQLPPYAESGTWDGKTCIINKCQPSDSIYTYTLDTDKNKCNKTCTPDGCKKYILDGDDKCVADCDDPGTYYHDVFSQSNCAEPLGGVYKDFKAKRDSTGRTCIPYNTGGLWGSCGNPANPAWALSDDKKHCEGTTFYERARYVDKATDGNTMGCVLCPPIKCKKGVIPTSEDFKQYCNSDEEKGCGYAGVSDENALNFCIDSNKELEKYKQMKFKDKGAQIGNFMFVKGGEKAVRGSPVVPAAKYIRGITVRGSIDRSGYFTVYAKISGSEENIVESSDKSRKSETNIPIYPGQILSFKYDYHYNYRGRPRVTTTTMKTVKYEDIDETVCWYANKDFVDVGEFRCDSDWGIIQPPAPKTNPCLMAKCPIDMPGIYYANRDSRDPSRLYRLDNWPGCYGAVLYYMTEDQKTIGQAYDIVLGERTNDPDCANYPRSA